MNNAIRLVGITVIVITLFWSWPYRLFTKKNNCYFYTLERILMEGGTCKVYRSRWWWGYHISYIKDGFEYHYDMTREERKMIKGFPFFYNGTVRKVKHKITPQ
jgi:hypothetical protein